MALTNAQKAKALKLGNLETYHNTIKTSLNKADSAYNAVNGIETLLAAI